MTVCLVIITYLLTITTTLDCDTSWTETSSTFRIPTEIDSIFIPFKLSNYLFIIGYSSNQENVLIYYHNLNNYTSLLSSLYDKPNMNYKSFKSEINNFISVPLNWHLLSSEKQLFSQSNDTIYPFISYPSTFFTDKSSNNVYIFSPIHTQSIDTIPTIWKLHINIPTPMVNILSTNPSNIDITFYWENIADLLLPVTSSCIVYDKIRNIAFILGGIDSNHQITNKVQAFYLSNYTFTFLSDMISPRRLSSCSLFNNDFIYIFGGNNAYYANIEQYDIISNKWIALNDNKILFPFQRYATSAIQLKKNNLIYIIGGLVNNVAATSRIAIFDANKSLLQICKNINNSLKYDRGAANSLVIADTIWTFGGYSSDKQMSNDMLVFDQSITIGISYNEFVYEYNNISIQIINNNKQTDLKLNTMSFGNWDILLVAIFALVVFMICTAVLYYFNIRYCIIKKYNNNNRKKSSSLSQIDIKCANNINQESEMIDIDSRNNNNNYSLMNSSYSRSVTKSFSNTFTKSKSTTKSFKLPHSNKAPLLYVRDSLQKQTVIQWFTDKVGLPEYIDVFFENGFDRMIFIENVTEKDLIDMYIEKIGHRKCILQQIKIYKMKQIEKKYNQNRKRNHNSIAETLHISKTFNNNNLYKNNNELNHSKSAKLLHFKDNKSLGSLQLYNNIKSGNKIINNHRSSTESICGSHLLSYSDNDNKFNEPIKKLKKLQSKQNRRYRTRRYNNKLNRSLSSTLIHNENGSESDELYESSPSPQSMPINITPMLNHASIKGSIKASNITVNALDIMMENSDNENMDIENENRKRTLSSSISGIWDVPNYDLEGSSVHVVNNGSTNTLTIDTPK